MPEQAQPQSVKPVLKSGCPDCPPMVVPRRGYTPTRPSCIHCVEKHVGAAMVLLAELNDLPDDEATRRQGFSRRLRAIGHLFEAEDESQEWPELHAAIRAARRAYQADGTMPDFEDLGILANGVRSAL
ncbi:MAG: hypothetical protein ACP5DC_07395 [Halothiobacillaceae bacterium]